MAKYLATYAEDGEEHVQEGRDHEWQRLAPDNDDGKMNSKEATLMIIMSAHDPVARLPATKPRNRDQQPHMAWLNARSRRV